jgi:hypothetical protein
MFSVLHSWEHRPEGSNLTPPSCTRSTIDLVFSENAQYKVLGGIPGSLAVWLVAFQLTSTPSASFTPPVIQRTPRERRRPLPWVHSVSRAPSGIWQNVNHLLPLSVLVSILLQPSEQSPALSTAAWPPVLLRKPRKECLCLLSLIK